MKRLPSAEQYGYQLEVGECDCGCHFGIDTTFLEQVGDFVFVCHACGAQIDRDQVH